MMNSLFAAGWASLRFQFFFKLAAAMALGDMPYASGLVIYVDGGLTMNRL